MKNKEGIGFKAERSGAVWEHLGFKPNGRGEPLNLCEPVCRICCKTVATKRSNTTSMHLHLKHNHPMQFSQLQKNTTDHGTSPSSRQSLGRLVDNQSTNRTVQMVRTQCSSLHVVFIYILFIAFGCVWFLFKCIQVLLK